MKYLFWDFNGTILNDIPLTYEILIEMLKEEQRPLLTYDEYLMVFGFPVEDYYALVYDLNQTPFQVLAKRFIDRYQPRSLEQGLNDHVVETIKTFEKQGMIHVLLSASEINNLNQQIDHYGIRSLFKDVLGTSDVLAKSKLEVAKNYIQQHRIDPKDMIMIGDTLHDAEIADHLGCRVILYTKGNQHPSRLTHYENIDDFRQLLDKIKV
jgi:phosphoglycolate phosphatase